MSKKTTNESSLEKEIERLLSDMADEGAETDEYAAMAARLDTLYKLKEVDHKIDTKTFMGVNNETLALIVANLTGIIMIVGHERARTITTKSLGFVRKLF